MTFYVYGAPVGKGRPRFSRRGVYTPQKTADWEKKVAEAYKEKFGNFMHHKGDCLSVNLTFLVPIPKSYTKKQMADIDSGALRPDKKPDIDNLCKAVFDALNKIAYDDDSQILSVTAEKIYSTTPGVRITINKT